MRICEHNNKICFYHDCPKFRYEEYIEKWTSCEDVNIMSAEEYRNEK